MKWMIGMPLIAACLASSGIAEENKPVRMLWLGSSSTYYHDQPKHACDWLVACGKWPKVTPELVGKSGTGIHVYLRPDFKAQYGLKPGQTVLNRIHDGRFDYVVLQMVTYFIVGNEGEEFEKATDAYCKAIHDAGSEPVFYEMGWGSDEREGPGRARIFEAAVRNKVRIVAPCSTAWSRVRTERPDLELHNLPDRTHPGSLGCYLNYCCFFAAFTRTSPVGLPIREVKYWAKLSDDEKAKAREQLKAHPPTDPYVASLPGWMQANSVAARTLKLDDDVAAYLQKVAWETWQEYDACLKEAGK